MSNNHTLSLKKQYKEQAIAPRKEHIHMNEKTPWAINIPLADFIGRLLSPKEEVEINRRRERKNYSFTHRGPGRKHWPGRKVRKPYLDTAVKIKKERIPLYMHAHAPPPLPDGEAS